VAEQVQAGSFGAAETSPSVSISPRSAVATVIVGVVGFVGCLVVGALLEDHTRVTHRVLGAPIWDVFESVPLPWLDATFAFAVLLVTGLVAIMLWISDDRKSLGGVVPALVVFAALAGCVTAVTTIGPSRLGVEMLQVVKSDSPASNPLALTVQESATLHTAAGANGKVREARILSSTGHTVGLWAIRDVRMRETVNASSRDVTWRVLFYGPGQQIVALWD
jgi:hypothetical protein